MWGLAPEHHSDGNFGESQNRVSDQAFKSRLKITRLLYMQKNASLGAFILTRRDGAD